MKAPGADDDGSGTVTILESLLLIACIKMALSNHTTLWSSIGILRKKVDYWVRLMFSQIFRKQPSCSRDVTTRYDRIHSGSIDQGIEPHFGLTADYTSVELNNFLKQIITTTTPFLITSLNVDMLVPTMQVHWSIIHLHS